MNHRNGDNSREHDPVELVEQSEVGSSLESKMLPQLRILLKVDLTDQPSVGETEKNASEEKPKD